MIENFGFIIINHFIGDFAFQTRMMGDNKWKSLYWLGIHVLVYTLVMGFLSFPFFPSALIWIQWLALNSFLHLCTDYVTSKLSHKFYDEKNYKYFWTTIGADQTIHSLILFYSYIKFCGL